MSVSREQLLSCLSVPRWADAVLAGEPYVDRSALLSAADVAARSLSEEELEQALSAHPRIGERGGSQSQREQAGVDPSGRLVAGNAAYEERFGRVFLIRAAGSTPACSRWDWVPPRSPIRGWPDSAWSSSSSVSSRAASSARATVARRSAYGSPASTSSAHRGTARHESSWSRPGE